MASGSQIWLKVPRQGVQLGPAVFVLAAVWYRSQGREGRCFASIDDLGTASGFCSRQTQRHLKRLTVDGYLRKRETAGRQTVTHQLTAKAKQLFGPERDEGDRESFVRVIPREDLTFYETMLLFEVWSRWSIPAKDIEGPIGDTDAGITYRSWRHLCERCGLTENRGTNLKHAAEHLQQLGWFELHTREGGVGFVFTEDQQGKIRWLFDPDLDPEHAVDSPRNSPAQKCHTRVPKCVIGARPKVT